MIVGDPDRFAVEFELDSSRMSEPDYFRWLWGRIRWWCGGQSVGIFEPQAQLIDAVVPMEIHLRRMAGGQGEDLIDEPAESAFRTVMAAIYEDRGQSFEQMREEGAPVGSVPVGPQVYEFDPWRLFLFEDDTRGRLLWKSRDHYEFDALVAGVPLQEVWLRAGEFDGVQKRFLDEIAAAEREFTAHNGQ